MEAQPPDQVGQEAEVEDIGVSQEDSIHLTNVSGRGREVGGGEKRRGGREGRGGGGVTTEISVLTAKAWARINT